MAKSKPLTQDQQQQAALITLGGALRESREIAKQLSRATDYARDLAHARDLARDLAHTNELARDLAHTNDLVRDLADAHAQACALAINLDLARGSALDLAFGRVGASLRALDRSRELVEALDSAIRRTEILIATERAATATDLTAPKAICPDPEPPARAEYLLECLTQPERAEEIAGSLLERFDRVAAKHGVRKARRYYWWQVLSSAPGLLAIRFRDLAILAGLTKAYDLLHQYWSTK